MAAQIPYSDSFAETYPYNDPSQSLYADSRSSTRSLHRFYSRKKKYHNFHTSKFLQLNKQYYILPPLTWTSYLQLPSTSSPNSLTLPDQSIQTITRRRLYQEAKADAPPKTKKRFFCCRFCDPYGWVAKRDKRIWMKKEVRREMKDGMRVVKGRGGGWRERRDDEGVLEDEGEVGWRDGLDFGYDDYYDDESVLMDETDEMNVEVGSEAWSEDYGDSAEMDGFVWVENDSDDEHDFDMLSDVDSLSVC